MRFGRRNPFLYDIEDLPMSFTLKLQVENVLLLFMMYLAAADDPPLRGSTIRAYVGHVKSLHVRHTQGLGFVAMMSATSRIGSVFKTLRVSRPSMLRTKNAFTNEHWCIFYDVVENLKAMGTLSAAQMFRVDRVRTAVAAALTVLWRSSEFCNNDDAAAANTAPIMVAELRFMEEASIDSAYIARAADGTPGLGKEGCAGARSRMPPSKSDPVQRGDNDLFFPPKHFRATRKGALELLVDFLTEHPVPLAFQPLTPLFRDKRQGACKQWSRRDFIKDFRWVCRQADQFGMHLEYSTWGTHAFRVGGMNALQDAGCTVAEIMAMGRWKSDAWLLYSRRNRPRLMYWSAQILANS